LTELECPDGFTGHNTKSIDWAGYSLSFGDLNNDGYDELLVGAPKHAGSAGRVYILYGSADCTHSTVDLATLTNLTTSQGTD
jgi:hypothetical protein